MRRLKVPMVTALTVAMLLPLASTVPAQAAAGGSSLSKAPAVPPVVPPPDNAPPPGNPPPAAPSADNNAPIVLPDPVVGGLKAGQELVERRTATSKTFLGDRAGEFRTEAYAAPIHYRDAQGRWADIKTNLAAPSDGRRHSGANRFDLSVATTSTDAALAQVSLDADHTVAFGLEGATKTTGRTDAKSITYFKARPETDVRLTSRPDGLKEELTLASAAAPDRFVFPLRLKGLSASIDEGGDVVYRDSAGTERARTPHGFMTDARIEPATGEPARSTNVTYALIPRGKGVALEVRIDRAWLNDPARVWPVTVDPQIAVASGGDDTFVLSPFHADNSYSAELKVGTYNGGANVARSYMHFDTRLLAGANVTRAELQAAERHSWNCAAWPEAAYRVTQGWNGRTMQDFPGAAVDPNWAGGQWGAGQTTHAEAATPSGTSPHSPRPGLRRETHRGRSRCGPPTI